MNQWLAMVALKDEVLPGEAQIAKFLRETWPEGPRMSDVSRRGGLLSFRVGEAATALTLIPMPIDAKHLTGPVECAWYWPEAARQLQDHRAHVLAMLLDDVDDPAGSSILLTRLVAAVADQSDSAGVFWGPGRLVHQPGAFVDQSRQMARDDMPLYLWIDFRIETEDDRHVRLFTTGMEALGYKEIEVAAFPGPPQQLRELVYNVAHYIIEKQQMPNDGNTMGDGAMQVVVEHTRSFLDDTQPVLRLEV